MTLSIFVKGKINFRHVQIWLWIYLLKEKLTLDMFKYNFEYICQRKSWLWICQNMTLSVFVKGKVDFRHVEIWLWVYLLKEKLTLDMSEYDFEYVCLNFTYSNENENENKQKKKPIWSFSHFIFLYKKINTNKIIIIISKVNVTNIKQTLLRFHLIFPLLI
jgi:hypothetical protein